MDEKRSKHNEEDAANNNGSTETEIDGEAEDEELEKNEAQPEEGENPFGPGYFSIEALQKMAQFVTAAMANSGDNEDAQKQLAVLQSTLFTLQHQQLFQMQLIQQLQSQLSINRSDNDNENDDGEDGEDGEEGDDIEDEREEGELTEEQMAEEQRKYEEEQRAIEAEKKERNALSDKEKEKLSMQPLNPNGPQPLDSLSAMEASFSSSFASSIITNHDEPSSMDGLNSLEMLQKRAEEVLDSASRGILSGSLTDEMSFKSDGKGRNEPFFKHRCRYCGKVFGSDSALQIHIRSHTGERPFKCNVCGSRFTTKGNLKVHFQRHTQKFPHIHMNPNPIPEHLDKFYPSLLPPLPPGQQPPLSPPPPPQNSRPPAPPQINLPFPPIPGLPPGFASLQGLPGLPFLRPPFDLIKQMSAHPFFCAAMREAGHQLPDQDAPDDLSKATDLTKIPIKEEPKEEKSTSPQPEKDLPDERKAQTPIGEKRRRSISPTTPPSWKEDKSEGMSPARSIENYSPKNDQPENLSSKISSKLSPSSVGSHRENHFHDGPNEIKMFPKLLPRPGSNDNSWESFIEVDKSSETSKLQQFVDNIESKITEPNECGVCHKVLSCHSALIMHYRTHTGIRPFKCLICGRKFTTKGNLKTHMSVHRMKPPMRTVHQCPVCHKKYSNALVLQQHIRLHTGEPTDLTLEQISAAEITGISSAAFPMGLNPFAFPIPGLHQGNNMMGPESSNGDNEDFMDEDFENESNFEDQMSNTGSVSGDSTQNISRANNEETSHTRAINAMLAEHSKSLENLSRAPSAASHAESAEEKRSSSPRTPPQVSPSPSDMSQGALDLTPRSDTKSAVNASLSNSATANLAGFPNFPFMPHGVNTSSPMMTSALNSLAQSVAPMGPFNPMALAGVRGATTCKICFKTFACQSALEIHYRSHTKERPYKCSICDKAFTTKGNMKQHMMTHKLRDMPQHMFNSNPMEPANNLSSDHSKESGQTSSSSSSSSSIRVKTEAELSPRSTDNSRGSISNQERADRRERSLSSQFTSPADANYQLMLERQQQLQLQQQQQQQLQRQLGREQSPPNPLHLQHLQSLTSPHKYDFGKTRSSEKAASEFSESSGPSQHIKNENRHKSSSSLDTDEPSPKRQLLSEPLGQDIPNSLKDAYHMPPQHPEEKTASHLERLQQFHSSSLLSQPIKMEPSHLKLAATSPGSADATGDQKHFCHLCQKNFSSTSSLQIHMRTHTGERPFVCNVCQKAFTTKGNLKVHMGIHTWSGASRRGRRMSLELPFNGSMPLMLQSPDFLQRHSDFFHPYPPAHLLGRMQQAMSLEQQQQLERGAPLPASQIMSLANKYMNANGLAGHHNRIDSVRQPFSSTTPSPVSDKQISPNSIRDEIIESPKRNGDHSPLRSGSTDLSPRMWKLHYESKTVNRENAKGDDQTKSVEELIA